VIAEFKRRSPSAGDIRAGATPGEVAREYEEGGAAALSVLTEMPHFGGSLDDLRDAREACVLPVLQKDFTVDRYQLYEAAVSGADAVLLIVAALEPEDLAGLYDEARGLDLDVVVEVHDEPDLETALTVDAEVIGINNRNLDDFTVDLQTTFELITDVPAGKTVVSESGISDRATLEELERVGVDAVLIGEALMRADDPAAKLRELTPDEDSTREHLL
jgi:indole-3-glycerol phosphate synthase